MGYQLINRTWKLGESCLKNKMFMSHNFNYSTYFEIENINNTLLINSIFKADECQAGW